MVARLATAEVKLRLDINFGDPVTPAPKLVELPALRPGGDPIRVLGYPVETVLAEKLVTAIDLGAANTRVRDFADVYAVTGSQSVGSDSFREALEATARFRGVSLRPLGDAVQGLAALRFSTYQAYRRALGATTTDLPESFHETISAAIAFVDPVLAGMDGRAVWEPHERRWE